MKRVDSPNNPLVKTLKRLTRGRKREARFVLEGRKLVEEALLSGMALDPIVVSEGFQTRRFEGPVVELPDGLFREVSTLESPEGVLAVAERPRRELPPDGVVLVAAGVRDPGNLGAIARVVEASGAAGLAVLRGSADPFGAKALRGSMGSLLRVSVVELASLAAVAGRRKLALVPREGTDYRDVGWSAPVAVVVGGESRGLDAALLHQCDETVHIPMAGAVESLNVATAAALVLYEAARRNR